MNNIEIEKLFAKNKLFYRETKLPIDVPGISYFENNRYLVIINTEYTQYREDLIDNTIEILANNFCCSKQTRSTHDINIEKIIEDIKKHTEK